MGVIRVCLDAACQKVVRVGALGLLIAAMSAGSAWAQQAAPALGFTAPAGMLLNTIKADKTADFEQLMGRVKEALAKSENPVRKQQAAGWKIYKAVEPGAGGNVLYVFFLDPAVPEAEYDPSRIFNEVFPNETQDFFAKLKEAFVSLNKINLNLVMSMQ